MNKVLLLAIVIVGILGGAYFGFSGKPENTFPQVASVKKVFTPKITATPTQLPVGNPVTIQINSIGVDAAIEQVGLDKLKRMDVPKNVYNTGWYKLGPKPGEIGNAVIDGHVDTPTGAPSVFADLDQLKKGDTIMIIDEKGKKLTFSVTGISSYNVDSFPIQTVFGPYNKPRLNLITCGGVWDKAKREYTQRTVVFSELVR